MRTGQLQHAGLRMLDVHKHLARDGDMWIRHQPVDGVDWRRRHPGGQHPVHDLVDAMPVCPSFDNRLDLGVSLDALGIGVEALVVLQVRPLDHLADQLPELVVRGGDDDVAVVRPERVIRVGGLIAVADALRDAPVGQIDLRNDFEAGHDGV